MKRLITALGGLGLLLFVAAGGGSAAGSPTTNGSNAQSNSIKTITHTCTDTSHGGGMPGDDADYDGDTISFSGATVLWPPNHKYRTVTITATDTDTGGELIVDYDYTTLHTMAVSNQPELGGGSGHTLDDTNPATASTSGNESASQDIQLRGERAGHDPTKAGRTYTITAMATFDGMGSMNAAEHCNATFTVTVPHDMGNR
jgi:hypothetical protein